MTLYQERLLPHDIEAEEALIGSILIDGSCFSQVQPILKPEDFYRERNASCYTAATALFSRNQAIDQTTIAGELSRTDQLDATGGMAYLSHLVSITPTSIHAADYATIIWRTSTMRKLIRAATRISELGYNDTGDVDLTLRQAEDLLYTVRGSLPGKGPISIRQMADQYFEDISRDLNEQDQLPILTGFSHLDNILTGLQRSDLIIVGARPSMGKTAFATNLALNAAKAGQTALLFSLEMTTRQIFLRFLASETGINLQRLRLRLYTAAEEDLITNAVGQLSDLPIWADDTRGQTAAEIRSKSRRLTDAHGLDLVLIDYLQLLRGHGRAANRNIEIGEITSDLKTMAGDLNTAVVCCSQLNRMVNNRPNHRPLLSDLRDSGNIEQDADVIIFIHREDAYLTAQEWEEQHPDDDYPENIAELIVAKQRSGPTGTVRLYFENRFVRFEPL